MQVPTDERKDGRVAAGVDALPSEEALPPFTTLPKLHEVWGNIREKAPIQQSCAAHLKCPQRQVAVEGLRVG